MKPARLLIKLGMRQMAAADMALHGPGFNGTEFAVGVCLPAGLGVLFLIRKGGPWNTTFGAYLLLLALNYIPLLIHAVQMRTRERALTEAAELLADRSTLLRISKMSLLLLVPLVPFVLELLQQFEQRTGT